MKVIYSIVLSAAVLAACHGYPATKDDKNVEPNTEYDFVPLEAQQPGGQFSPGGVIDVDAGGFFGNPFVGNPFPSLLSSIEGIMARMRQQLNQILGRLPSKPEDSPFPELHIPNIGDIDLGKGNTTSVIKVIDGHKVTINETEYKQDSDNGASFFKVRIIDVHPDGEDASTEKDSEAVLPAKGERESIEETLTNEILKTKDNEELNLDNIETFDEMDSTPHKFTNPRRNVNWNNLRSVESIEDNSIDTMPKPFRDLSNDIYVNQLLLNSGAPTNPDAEVFKTFNAIPSPDQKQNKITPHAYLPLKHDDFEEVGMRPVFHPNVPYFPQPIFPLNNEPLQMPHPNSQFMNHPSQFTLFQPLPHNQGFLPQPPFSTYNVGLKQYNYGKSLNGIPSNEKNSQKIEKRESSSTSNAPEQLIAENKVETSKASVPST